MPSLKLIAPHTHDGAPLFDACAAFVFVALAIAPTSVLAAAQVRGSPEVVGLEVQDTSIEEILAALGASFEVHYKSGTKLEKRLTGTYAGSLQRVVMRILEGYNFIAKTNKGRIEITVLGTQNAPVETQASPASSGSEAGPNPPASTKSERPASAPPLAPIKVTEAHVASPDAPMSAANLAQGSMPVPSLSPGFSAPPFVSEPRTSAVAPPMPLMPLAPGSAPPFVSEPRTSAVAPLMPLAPGSAPPFVSEPQTSAVAPPMPLTPLAPGSVPPFVSEPQTSAVAPSWSIPGNR